MAREKPKGVKKHHKGEAAAHKGAAAALSSIVKDSIIKKGSSSGRVNKKPKRKKGFWLKAWYDPLAVTQAYTECVRFADVLGNGDYHLIVATLDRKLKLFRGVQLTAEHKLMAMPVAMCTLYIDALTDKTPAVAVASGPYVFIYRNLHPFFKFTIPPEILDEKEMKLWTDLSTGNSSDNDKTFFRNLSKIRDDGASLSCTSLQLLAIEDTAERTLFINKYKNTPLVQKTVITCMEVLSKDSDEEICTSRLVIGTENKQILIVNPVNVYFIFFQIRFFFRTKF
eukprot:GSMAST32.ASY1.ANO1.1967.1 assembled CDS